MFTSKVYKINTIQKKKIIIVNIAYIYKAQGIPTKRAYFGEGTGPIHFTRAQCGSCDTRLINCTIDMTGINGCDHDEDAGVICQGEMFYLAFVQSYYFTIINRHK